MAKESAAAEARAAKERAIAETERRAREVAMNGIKNAKASGKK